MRAFVTGSTGLLGGNLVRTLLEAGHEVVALARSKDKAARELSGTGAQIVVGDVTDAATFADALAGIDVVFHTAAFFREYYAPGDHANAVERVNVQATIELARAAQARGVKRMVHTSSAGIIGLKPDGSAGDETTPPWPRVAKNLYLRSKLSAESLLLEFSRERAFFAASALPAWMWGPYDTGPTASGQLVFDALRSRLPPAIPPGGASIVDARDVALGMLRIAETGRSGERYILSGPFIELAELIAALAALCAVEAPKVRLPFAAALAFAGVAEIWSRVTGEPSAMSIEAIRLMHARLAVSAAKTERELGMRYRPFAQTLVDTVAWARTQLREGSATITGNTVRSATRST